jgi:hypothetical protein
LSTATHFNALTGAAVTPSLVSAEPVTEPRLSNQLLAHFFASLPNTSSYRLFNSVKRPLIVLPSVDLHQDPERCGCLSMKTEEQKTCPAPEPFKAKREST